MSEPTVWDELVAGFDSAISATEEQVYFDRAVARGRALEKEAEELRHKVRELTAAWENASSALSMNTHTIVPALQADLATADSNHERLKRMYDALEQERDSLRAKVEELENENRSLKFNLDQKSGEIGRAEHRGNTVDYIYDKLAVYSKQLLEVVYQRDALRTRLKAMEGVVDAARGLSGREIYASEIYFQHRDVLRDALARLDGLPK